MVNIRDDLAESLNLRWGQYVIKLILDYENVPFRCRRCRAYGHPASECGFSYRREKRRWVSRSEVEPSSRGDGTGPSNAQTLSTTSLSGTSNPATNGSCNPVDLGFHDLGEDFFHPSGQETLSQLNDGGSFPAVKVHSSLYEADLQLKDDDLLKAVLS